MGEAVATRLTRLCFVEAGEVLAEVPGAEGGRPGGANMGEELGAQGLFEEILAREAEDAGDDGEVGAVVLAEVAAQKRQPSFPPAPLSPSAAIDQPLLPLLLCA